MYFRNTFISKLIDKNTKIFFIKTKKIYEILNVILL